MPDEIPDFDLYAELEVSERASPETISAAYRSLQLRNHPDRAGPGAGDRAVRLNIARDWLLNPARRAEYDAHLAARRHPAGDEPDAPPAMADEDGVGDEAGDLDGSEDSDDAEGVAVPGGHGLASAAARHLRIDVRRLGRIWIAGLAFIGAVALVPGAVEPVWARLVIAATVALVLVGVALGGLRSGDDGVAARMVRGAGVLLGWIVLALLAVSGIGALAALARGEPVARGIADVAVPALAVTAILSLFAVRRRSGPLGATVDDFLEMTPREFESAVGEILGRQGYRLDLTGGPGDLVADLSGTDPRGRPTVVQCKRYAPGHPVGSRDVQLLIAMGVRHHNAEHLVLVTTSDFTDPAIDLAADHGVTLIAGADLEALTR